MFTTVALTAVLLATVAAAPGVSAQAPTAEHPAVGAWIIDPPEDTTTANELLLIGPGGIASSVSPEGSGYGSWSATGERSAGCDLPVPAQ
jgi:hypothetical protein